MRNRREDYERYLKFPEIIRLRLRGRVGLYAPQKAAGGDFLHRVTAGVELPLALQHALWWQDGRFYVLGGHVLLHEAWEKVDHPWPSEAQYIEDRLGVRVTGFYEKGSCDPEVFRWPPWLEFG